MVCNNSRKPKLISIPSGKSASLVKGTCSELGFLKSLSSKVSAPSWILNQSHCSDHRLESELRLEYFCTGLSCVEPSSMLYNVHAVYYSMLSGENSLIASVLEHMNSLVWRFCLYEFSWKNNIWLSREETCVHTLYVNQNLLQFQPYLS